MIPDFERLEHVLVVGCQRTGTNLTGLILGTHPQSLLIEESDGAYDYLLAEPADADKRLVKALGKAKRKYKSPKLRFKNRHQVDPSVSHLIFQVPNCTYDYEALAGKLTNCRFVFPTRDARDVVCSMANLSQIPMVENQLRFMRERPHISEAFAEEIALLEDALTPIHVRRALVWRVKTSILFTLMAEPFRAFWLRYEDLVESPSVTSKNIMAAVNLPDLGDELTRSALNETYQGTGMGGTDRTWQIRQSSVGRWRDRLSATEEDEIWEVAGGVMTRLGYAR